MAIGRYPSAAVLFNGKIRFSGLNIVKLKLVESRNTSGG